MKLIIRNISVHTFSVAFFRHYVSTLNIAGRRDNAHIFIYWKYAEAEIVIRRNIRDWIADNWLVCTESCLISACLSELKWIAHRFVRPMPHWMYALWLFIDLQSGRTTHWKMVWYNAVAFGINLFMIINQIL